MYEIVLFKVGETKRFKKIFESEYLYKKFLNLAKRSKKVVITSYGKV